MKLEDLLAGAQGQVPGPRIFGDDSLLIERIRIPRTKGSDVPNGWIETSLPWRYHDWPQTWTQRGFAPTLVCSEKYLFATRRGFQMCVRCLQVRSDFRISPEYRRICDACVESHPRPTAGNVRLYLRDWYAAAVDRIKI